MAGIMNRQCRTVAVETESGDWHHVEEEWSDYGNIAFFEAVRRHSVEEATNSFIFKGKIKVQTRDEDCPEQGSPTFTVELSINVDILNPRLDTDKIADNVSVKRRGLISKFWNLF
jgi:hypothetical protein